MQCPVIIEMLQTSDAHDNDLFAKLTDYHSWAVKEAKGIPNVGTKLVQLQ